MASIFANSYFTIIAMEGDNSDYGLRGVNMASVPHIPRVINQMMLNFSDQVQMLGDPPGHRHRSYEYNRRGWTFQEEGKD